VKSRIIHRVIFVLFFTGLSPANGQTWSIHGQASTWLTVHPESPFLAQPGLRYLPEGSMTFPLGNSYTADLDVVVNGTATASFGEVRVPSYDASAKLYRAWIRIASERLEFRAGLQKLNFGSATIFRPLMWFDKVDPRDPLQLTDGVYGALARYYFLDNANLWLWGLYGNTETKGWEFVPTTEKSFEYGVRAQIAAWTGELGATYHHRVADFTKLLTNSLYAMDARTPEDRFALDGKWNIGIGTWFEAAMTHTHTDIPGRKYQRQWTLGADYTFDIGNGLNALTEYFRSDNPETPFADANGLRFSAFSLSYPLGLIDRISCILYRDWSSQEWYRMLTWQKTYDNWVFYLLGFWNPQNIQTYQNSSTNIAGRSSTNLFSGTGIQLMIVFNH
jgi:hypothetical protein